MTHLVRLVVAAASHVIARGQHAVIQLPREADRHKLKEVMGRHEKPRVHALPVPAGESPSAPYLSMVAMRSMVKVALAPEAETVASATLAFGTLPPPPPLDDSRRLCFRDEALSSFSWNIYTYRNSEWCKQQKDGKSSCEDKWGGGGGKGRGDRGKCHTCSVHDSASSSSAS